ncbi:hypothetical protein [Escherichia albertii]|uniref:hypothetical protein n=1 Tax=Escherichia albertii TaxID=208962 RepID=UPI00283A92DE|nr:hypothetical protein [Escherichia albertii]MDE8029567.1 hypothetical protein [Escherichia coli]WMV69470.1 hypothetical protein Q0121_25655 [Escherichia albertii]
MTERILFVFEGEKTEKTITDSLLKKFIENDKRVVLSSFKTDIYSLYKLMSEDEDLDVFAVLKEKNPDLVDLDRDSFSQLFLFFDYDGHAPAASDEKIDKLLSFFNEETENGKLFISYPMVESIKCISHIDAIEDFCRHTVKICDCSKFKGYVAEYAHKSLIHFNLYSDEIWNDVVRMHCVKSNFIMKGNMIFPSNYFSQKDIFGMQKSKYIDPNGSVSTLSSFPMLLLDFFGHQRLFVLVSGEQIEDGDVLSSEEAQRTI